METEFKPIKNAYLKAFLAGFLIFAAVVAPTLFTSKGAWTYYGDFNVQQIPFYMHVQAAIKNGNWLYDWSTDLGGGLIPTYAFYLIGSPFFYLTLLFPTKWIPWVMPWIYCIKYGLMSLTSYAYLRKNVKNDETAFLGAILFSFTGYQGSVLEFGHFHDVVAFFPLYLLTFDNLMQKKKYLPFALMTTFMAVLNYYFFVGEVVFLCIYFVGRYVLTEGKTKEKLMLLLRAFLTGAVGVALSTPYLLLAVSYVIGNGRVSDILNGYDTLSYKEPTMIWGIIKSAVMLSDVSGLKGLFNESMSRVAGLGAYIPMFGLAGVAAYLMGKKKDFATKVFCISVVFAAIPALNAVFSAFNDEYYARWFYMPVLIMVLMTVRVIEESVETGDLTYLKKGTLIELVAAVFLILCGLIPEKTEDGWQLIAERNNPEMFISEAIVTIVLIALLLFFLYKDKLKHRKLMTVTAAFLTAIAMMITGSALTGPEREVAFVDQAVLGESPLPEDDEFYRIETEECVYNYPLLWEGAHSVTSFISTIPSTTMDFYEGIGINRTVTSYINTSKIGVRALLSCKYFLIEKDTPVETISFVDDPSVLKGYKYLETNNGFDLYENAYFVPMGFSFEDYITEDEYTNSELPSASLDKLLIKALILSDEDAEKYGAYMNHLNLDGVEQITNADYVNECMKRKKAACSEFNTSTNGFTAKVDMNHKNLLFFSVPYEDKFTAYVDGVKTDIVKADYGLMAIPVDEGQHDIEFIYKYY